MTKIRTKQELEAFYEQARRDRERRKALKRQETAFRALKRQRVDKLIKEREKAATEAQKQAVIQITIQRLRTPIPIYHSNQFERDLSEEDLYTTREELMEAEERGEGSINWDAFDKLIQETREMLNERKKDNKDSRKPML